MSTATVEKKEKKQTAKQAETFSKSKGRTLGLGVGETWVALFKKNASAKKADRMTDEQITAFLNKEFPDRQSAIFGNVQGVRGKYNRGGFGDTPSTPSVPYDKDGNPVEVRRGRKPSGDSPAPKKGTKVKAATKKVVRRVVKRAAPEQATT